MNESKKIRLATSHDMDTVYRLGFDKWGEQRTEAEHLDICRNSPKYKRGTWYVLEDEDQQIVCTAIIYPLDIGLSEFSTIGIGSLATKPSERRKGHAAQLLNQLVQMHQDKSEKSAFVLWSDIDPRYYERFGFEALPASFQKKETSTVMLRPPSHTTLRDLVSDTAFIPPTYF